MVPVAVDLNESSSVLVVLRVQRPEVSARGRRRRGLGGWRFLYLGKSVGGGGFLAGLNLGWSKRDVNERSRGFSFEARSSDPVLWSRGSSGSGSALEASKAADLWVGFGHISPGEAYGEIHTSEC
ncbi:unnamed protein product [Brassica oleracea var. botrytis]